ncbi:hypothetical protein CDD81_3032 [Ophiocordyceps australis]|uniref:Fungal lipase-type domain-containing protein n=1 Tax=Ophiocordyceps australis TaxID=1399860 RepID=A0A2C5YI15_9HYPO|nr:hypothetical protein CDD81_3032 [Ophiocordyceps australis]
MARSTTSCLLLLCATALLTRLCSAAISTVLFADLERLSRLVDIAYCVGNTGVRKPFECLSRCNDFPDMTLVATWSTGLLRGDSCGYIALDAHSRGLIVAFRGTYSITNTIVDLSTMPQAYMPYTGPGAASCRNCTVHMGFLESWRNVRSMILPQLIALKAKDPALPIHLIGHSLGGAIACLAAVELKTLLGWENVVVTTFGEPRVGNYQLARFIDDVFQLDKLDNAPSPWYRRVTHASDPVPLLPWDEWGYRSHAGEIYISKKDLRPTDHDLKVCVGDKDSSCSTEHRGILGSDLPYLGSMTPVGTRRGGELMAATLPTRVKLWQLLFAHRDYFWRLGLCIPGGDPLNWGRGGLMDSEPDEL